MNRLTSITSETRKSFKYAVSSPQRTTVFGLTTIASFFIFVLLSFPGFVYQMFISGPDYWGYALTYVFTQLIQTSGLMGLILTGIYAVAIGVLLTALIGQLQFEQYNGLQGFLGVVPGLLVTGCAGCGTGLLGLLGVFGISTILPFSGNGVRIAGLLILLYALQDTGDPRECKIDVPKN